MCAYSNLEAGIAFTVSRPDGSLIDFVVIDNTAPLVPASGGPADGLIPRHLGVTVEPQVLSGSSLPDDACLEGTGIRASDFTWHTDCTVSMTILADSQSTGLNPNQTVTGFRQDCPRCQQDQMCLVPADCDPSLTCDPASLTCVPPS